MARNILDNIQFSQTYKDRIKKEEDAIYKFFVKHKDSYCSPEILGTASKVIRQKMEMNSLKHDRCNAILKAADERKEREETEYEIKAKERGRNGLEPGSSSTVDLMRPVSPDVKATLYEGISAEDDGRAKYLKLRKKKGPEEKYNFILSCSWEYGWSFRETADLTNIKKPHHHKNLFKNTLYNCSEIPVKGIDDIIQKKRFGL